MKDGSLLVSDDWNGAVYRVSYGKQKVAEKKKFPPLTSRSHSGLVRKHQIRNLSDFGFDAFASPRNDDSAGE